MRATRNALSDRRTSQIGSSSRRLNHHRKPHIGLSCACEPAMTPDRRGTESSWRPATVGAAMRISAAMHAATRWQQHQLNYPSIGIYFSKPDVCLATLTCHYTLRNNAPCRPLRSFFRLRVVGFYNVQSSTELRSAQTTCVVFVFYFSVVSTAQITISIYSDEEKPDPPLEAISR